jgi:hypothetical protein
VQEGDLIMTERISSRSSAVQSMLARREPFTTYGNFRAVAGGESEIGRLPEPYRTWYRDAFWRGDIAYTVYSYRTPIAWECADGSVWVPPVTYSPTTSRHQGLLNVLGQRPSGPSPLGAHRGEPPRTDRTPESAGRAVLAPAA